MVSRSANKATAGSEDHQDELNRESEIEEGLQLRIDEEAKKKPDRQTNPEKKLGEIESHIKKDTAPWTPSARSPVEEPFPHASSHSLGQRNASSSLTPTSSPPPGPYLTERPRSHPRLAKNT